MNSENLDQDPGEEQPEVSALDDAYLARLAANVARHGALLEARCVVLETGGEVDAKTAAADLRSMTLAVQTWLKEEGRVRDELRKQHDADGGPGIDLDAARSEIERRLALLGGGGGAGGTPGPDEA